jgi:hypothetical protein
MEPATSAAARAGGGGSGNSSSSSRASSAARAAKAATGDSTTDGLRGRRIGDSDRSGDSDRRRAGDSDRRGARIVAQARLVCLSDHGRARGSVEWCAHTRRGPILKPQRRQ